MNIDDLKDAWKNDQPEFGHASISAAIQGQTTSAVKKIRRKMKVEFVATIISYLILLAVLFSGRDPFLFNITCILFFTMILLNGYYFFKFYLFYQSMGRYDTSLKSSISKVAYELELNTEIYKTYNFCITPLAVMVAIAILCGKAASTFIQTGLSAGPDGTKHLLMILGIMLISFAVAFTLIEVHVKTMYGKYLNELKSIISDLDE
jgi:Zn-dependent membrane protease YugP